MYSSIGLSFLCFAIGIPVYAQTTYLVIKSDEYTSGVALHSIPMLSKEQCEEAGAVIISSSRFDTNHSTEDGFECIQGK